MKKIKYIILFFLTTALIMAGDNVFEFFTANSDGKVIKLEWKSINEDNYSLYEIERSSAKESFKKIQTMDCKGFPSNYYFTDDEAFFRNNNEENTPQSNNTFSYRIKIVIKDKSFFYSNTINVIHNVSSIRRSWGMIKQMFL